MQSIFLFCAIVGSAILLIQFAMALLGYGAEELELDGLDGVDAADADDLGGSHHSMDHDSSTLFKKLTFRSMVAAVAFFGIAGMSATSAELNPYASLGIALLAGGGALYAVGWLFQLLHRLEESGNLRIESAVGLPGTVYIPIPGGKSGTGKIQLHLQNRIVELRAITAERDRLPTGASVIVIDVINSNTVAVELAREPATT